MPGAGRVDSRKGSCGLPDPLLAPKAPMAVAGSRPAEEGVAVTQCLVCDGPTRVVDRRERSDRSIRRRRECLACGARHTTTEFAETALDAQQRAFEAAQQQALEEAQAAHRRAIETVRLLRAALTVSPAGSLVAGAPVRLPGVAFSRRRVMAPCPTCGGESWVMSHLSRGSDGTVRRRHACRSCFRRFTTVQRPAPHPLSDDSPARIEAVR